MHSGRMCTARSSSRLGGSPPGPRDQTSPQGPGIPQDQAPPQGPDPLGPDPRDQAPPQDQAPPGTRHPPLWTDTHL